MGIYSHAKHTESQQYKNAMRQKNSAEPLSKGWRTPYGFSDYTEPVTYEQACADMKAMSEKFFNQEKGN